jgi:uncharacterized protein (DUF924 family)
MKDPEEILDLWFGTDDSALEDKWAQWWMKDPDFDKKVRENFESTI